MKGHTAKRRYPIAMRLEIAAVTGAATWGIVLGTAAIRGTIPAARGTSAAAVGTGAIAIRRRRNVCERAFGHKTYSPHHGSQGHTCFTKAVQEPSPRVGLYCKLSYRSHKVRSTLLRVHRYPPPFLKGHYRILDYKNANPGQSLSMDIKSWSDEG